MAYDSLIDRIRNFALLTEEEQARVIEEVTERPDLAPDLETAMALAHVVNAAVRPEEPLVEIVDARLGHRPGLATSSGEDANEINARLDAFESEGESPLAEFERLTGVSLPPLAPEASAKAATAAHQPRAVNGHSSGAARTLVADRPPAARQKPHTAGPLARRLVFAGLAILALYGGAFAVSSIQTPERNRVADIGDISESFRAVRGQEVSDRYAAAVDLLVEARRSTIGLFPRYDDAALNAAADAFTGIARDVPNGHYGQEAALALGRIRLLQGDIDAARIALESVVAHGAYRAPEAAKLLDYLDAQG